MPQIKHKGYTAVYDFHPDTNLYVGRVLSDRLIVFISETLDGVQEALEESIEEYENSMEGPYKVSPFDGEGG